MAEDTTVDPVAETADPDPVALSLAGGAVGTITGLKRGGLPGAITGGLFGGTVGYVAGAVSRGPQPVDDATTDPISIDPSGGTAEDDETTATADDTDEHTDTAAETAGDQKDDTETDDAENDDDTGDAENDDAETDDGKNDDEADGDTA